MVSATGWAASARSAALPEMIPETNLEIAIRRFAVNAA
jgi:hypothetical protein